MIDDLTGARLRMPSVQPEALPLSEVKPSPCGSACPAGINVKAYVSLIAEGRFADALETIRERCPLPGVCGRICHHPCERACKRSRYDEALAIRALKRFVADHEREFPDPRVDPIHRAEKIAVIGSGPAGLTAAYDLRRAGYAVTVMESEAEAGGMLRYGIADYRLPPDVLETEIGVIRRAGVEIITERRIGRDITFGELKSQGYAAILVAVGAQRGRRLGLDGEEKTPEVEDALSFLRRVKAGDRTPIAGHVIVVGGGSTAVEAARTAIRLGAKSVEILYRRFREELLADKEEIEAAEAEGVQFRFLVAPKKLIRKRKKLSALECIRIGLGEPDASGRRRPIEIPGTEFTIAVDRIFAAIGQSADFDFLPDGERSLTGTRGVFAAGDAVTGPATVIDAIAGGHRAADSIREFLEGAPVPATPTLPAAVEYELPDSEPLHAPRLHVAVGSPSKSQGGGSAVALRGFEEFERAFTAEEAIAEARRCLRCGPCAECRTCATTCNRRHIMVRTEDGSSAIVRSPAALALALDATRAIAAQLVMNGASLAAEVLPARNRVDGDRCRSCGRCVEVCPFHAVSLNGEGPAKIDAALCRGCGLCSAVCPTSAAMSSALSPEWWSNRLDEVIAARPAEETLLVLACQRRAGSLERGFDDHGTRVEIVRLRCVGQVDSGMLLELARQPFTRLLVAGCDMERCRFTSGAWRASEQVERAQKIMRALGLDPSRVTADWGGH